MCSEISETLGTPSELHLYISGIAPLLHPSCSCVFRGKLLKASALPEKWYISRKKIDIRKNAQITRNTELS